jgi:ATP-binding cassette subfamily C protein
MPSGHSTLSDVVKRARANRADLPTVVASVRTSWSLLTRPARRRYVVVVAAQMATGVLDLIGVALVGLVGLAATSAVSGSTESLESLPLVSTWDTDDPVQLAAVLALAAAAALILRSVLYALLLRVNYRLLARSQAEAAVALLGRFMTRPITDIHDHGSQSTAYALTVGAGAAITGLLGSVSVVLTDAALLVLLGVGLLLIDPVVTVAAAVYLGIVAFGVHAALAGWSARNGSLIGQAGVSTLVAIQEGISLHRELWALGRIAHSYGHTRERLETASNARATQTLIGQIPRVVYDVALVAGALLLAAWQIQVADLPTALATLLVFVAAASRIIPSLLRINGQLIQLRSAAGQARPTYELAQRLEQPPGNGWRGPPLTPADPADPADPRPDVAGARVTLTDVSYQYPTGVRPVLNGVSLTVQPGCSVALVGPTGGGKSTLVDSMVGLLVPDRGSVRIDDGEPLDAVLARPGSVAYVPQRVALVEGTVRENIAIALAPAEVDDARIWEALERAQAVDVVQGLPHGLDTRIGEHGFRLSGGQRQRIGLARALYQGPRLLILDEATSALDAQTEHAISTGLAALHGRVTLVVVAHRLAAVKDMDLVVYVEDGRIAAKGTFDEVVQQSPAFARQVEILAMPRSGPGAATGQRP